MATQEGTCFAGREQKNFYRIQYSTSPGNFYLDTGSLLVLGRLKDVPALGCDSVITAPIAQNTTGVHALPSEFVED